MRDDRAFLNEDEGHMHEFTYFLNNNGQPVSWSNKYEKSVIGGEAQRNQDRSSVPGLFTFLPWQSSRLPSPLSCIYINNGTFSCYAQSEISFSEIVYGAKLLFSVSWSSNH